MGNRHPRLNRSRTMKYIYYTSCVNFPGDVRDLDQMIDDAKPCKLSTIRRRCEGFADWVRGMGYGKMLRIEKDWHVKYRRSRLRGVRCYFVVHSGIEHIWVEGLSEWCNRRGR